MEIATEEAELIHRARSGEAAAFGELVRLFEGRVRAFFAAQMEEVARADDLAQETFLVAYRRLSAFDPSMPFYPWLKGIAQNLLRNERRKHPPLDSMGAKLEELVAEEAERFGDRDAVAALQECIEKLEGAAARMVDARYRAEQDVGSIARAQGRTAKAVSMALVRIRRQLRRCMETRIGDYR